MVNIGTGMPYGIQPLPKPMLSSQSNFTKSIQAVIVFDELEKHASFSWVNEYWYKLSISRISGRSKLAATSLHCHQVQDELTDWNPGNVVDILKSWNLVAFSGSTSFYAHGLFICQSWFK